MDPNLKKKLIDVGKVIESSTSKVSLRDLEKKGFRQVKVLRQGDINQLIFRAVQTVLAKQTRGLADGERDKILEESQAEFDRLMRQTQEAIRAQQSAAAEKETVEAQKLEIEKAKRQLEEKVGQLNAQLVAERRAFEQEKAQFQKDKDSLYTRGLDTQKVTVESHNRQVEDLKGRLRAAEERASRSEGSVSEEKVRELEDRYRTEIQTLDSRHRSEARDAEGRLKAELQQAEERLRVLESEKRILEDVELAKLRSRLEQTEDDLERARTKSKDLEASEDQLRARVRELEIGVEDVGRLRTRAASVDRAEEAVRSLKSRIAALEIDLQRSAAEGTRLQGETARLEQELEEARQAAQDSEEVDRLRAELAESRLTQQKNESRVEDLLTGLMTKLEEQRSTAAVASSDDVNKRLQGMQNALADQMQKLAGTMARGGSDAGKAVDLSGLFTSGDDAKMETNIGDVKLKEQAAKGVGDKLAKLKKFRGAGPAGT